MKLPIKLFEKKEKTEYYLALVLQNEKATAVIFEKTGNAIRYISQDDEYFPESIENATENEFLDTLDKVITTAETALPDNIETHKTLLGLKDNWIEDDKIKKQYRDKLTRAKDELALEPIGFLAFSESLINFMQKDEGAPVTAVLVNVGKKYLSVSWIKGSKILETKSAEIHESATYTADALMKHFQSGGTLPAKIVLCDSEDDELMQEFIAHHWSKSLSFLHIPQIVSLPKDTTAKAMLLGAATQMQTQLIFDTSRKNEFEENEDFEIKKENNEEPEEKEIDSEITDAKKDAFEENDEQQEFIEGNEKSMEYFGFVEEADVTKTIPEKPKAEIEIPEELTEELIEEVPEELKQKEERKFALPATFALIGTKIKFVIPVIFAAFKKIKLNKQLLTSFRSKNKLIIIIPAVVILLLSIFIFYIYLFKTTAQVNVYLNPKEEQKQTSVTFSSETDIKNKILTYELISVSEQGSISTNTTGKKYVGEKAKGIVTIFNNRDSSVTLNSGTKITSSNNLNFTLDNSVTVASATGDIFSGTKPGTTNTNVTAFDIGQDYNLPSGTKFSIGESSDVAAKNDNAFSGGTKKSITVVSKDDLNKLTIDLPNSLQQKARDDLNTKTNEGKTIIPQFIATTLDKTTFTKKEGDESSTVGLNATVNFQAISYLNKDLEELANSLLTENEKVSANNLTVTAQNIVLKKNKDIAADLTIKAQIFPKVNQQDLRKELSGVSLLKATNMLNNLPQIGSVSISFNPSIPFLPKNLPSDYNKIFINITSK